MTENKRTENKRTENKRTGKTISKPGATESQDSLLAAQHCISNNLQKTARAVSRVYADTMRPAGLGRSQFAILESLARQSPLPLSALADRLYMDRTTLTRNLKPLVEEAFIELEALPEDRRVKTVTLTQPGRAKLRQARRYWRMAQARTLAAYGEAEWRSLEAALRNLRHLVR